MPSTTTNNNAKAETPASVVPTATTKAAGLTGVTRSHKEMESTDDNGLPLAAEEVVGSPTRTTLPAEEVVGSPPTGTAIKPIFVTDDDYDETYHSLGQLPEPAAVDGW